MNYHNSELGFELKNCSEQPLIQFFKNKKDGEEEDEIIREKK